MNVFLPTLSQMGFLFSLIILGYVLARFKCVPSNSAGVLSKLENNAFMPALVCSTFLKNFNLKSLGDAWQYLVGGLAFVSVMIIIALMFSRIATKDSYLRNIYTYGLSFPNFAFMGNAIVSAIYPDVFMHYLIFVIPAWIAIYVWGVPYLLMPAHEKSGGMFSGLKNLANPMFIAMVVSMILGLSGAAKFLPEFIYSTERDSVISVLGACMSPVAMLLTGMTIAKISLKSAFTSLKIYGVSLFRLIVIPLCVIGALILLPIPTDVKTCGLCFSAMPLGLNTIVVPAAYGKDTSVASSLALISHLLSCITIPLVFMLYALTI